MDRGKIFANRGVPRNKKPLRNIVYRVQISQLRDGLSRPKYEAYKFKDEGYLLLYWKHEGDSSMNWHGFVTVDELKERLGEKQWGKFCQGKREFIMQRRVDGRNVPLDIKKEDFDEDK